MLAAITSRDERDKVNLSRPAEVSAGADCNRQR